MKKQTVNQNHTLQLSTLSYEMVLAQIKSMLPSPVEFEADQNLIELGLDSLQIMRLASKWRREGANVTFADLISSPFLKDWWSLLQNQQPVIPEESDSSQIGERLGELNAPFPLTDVQYAYWIGRREDQPLGGVGCHAYLEIDGQHVDAIRLESAWMQILEHHPMLRAKFLEDGRQEVCSIPFSKELYVHDLRHYEQKELVLELTKIRNRLSHRRLSVEKGEVAGLELSLLPEGRTRLHFDIDLLVADVQSLHIILRDLAAAYARGCAPKAPENWSFAAYLQKDSSRRYRDKQKAKEYWEHRLHSLPSAPELPLKISPETVKSPVFRRRNYFLSKEKWDLLQKQAAAYQVTPAMVLLTAYAEIIDRWSTNSQFLINVPIFDRQTEESGIEDVVADFTNLLLLAVDCSLQQSFLERVRSVQEQFHQDVAHAAYSGVQIQRDLARLRQEKRDFAPVVFACNLGTPLLSKECQATLGKLSYMISQTPQVWLDFQIYEMDEGLLLAWDAVDSLFPEGLIDQMFDAYTRLLLWLISNSQNWQETSDMFPILTEYRRNKDMDVSVLQSAECLHTSFFKYATRNPNETALIDSFSNTYYSYGELSKYALQIAAFLQEKGVKEGDPVAVSLPRGVEQIAAVFGILAIGACYVPISLEQPHARRESMHKKAGVQCVLTNQEQIQALQYLSDTSVLDIAQAANITPMTEPVAISPERIAYIIFTSGSTGEPKGVEISHAGAWNTISDVNRRYKVGSTDRILAISSLDFDLSVYDIFGLLSVGGSLVLITEDTRRDASYWLQLLSKYQITIWNSVPVLLDMLLVAAESQQSKIPSVRLTLLSGDWIGLDLPTRLQKMAEHARLIAMGGATEASIWSNYFEVSLPLPSHWTSIPYGRPLTNQMYRIVDRMGRDCPDWVAGELWIGGSGVALGYRGENELTTERFVYWNGSRWYRTGDLGRYWPDGVIEFLGRKDFQVKIRGHRIELGEIETALKQHPDVRDAIVTTAGDSRGHKYLVGYVVVSDQENESSLFQLQSADSQQCQTLWNILDQEGRERVKQLSSQKVEAIQVADFWEWMERVSLYYICRALENAGTNLEKGESYSLDSLMIRCGIQERYRGLVKEWLLTLEEKGLIEKDTTTDTYKNLHSISTNSSEIWKICEMKPVADKSTQSLLNYLQHVDQYSVKLLKGTVDPLEVFFKNELYLSPDDLILTLPGAEYRNDIASGMIGALVQHFSKSKPIRVLQLGARSVQFTESILSLFRPDETVYTLTDHSTFFTNAAKYKFKSYSFVQYKQLDISQDPINQGFDAQSYDVIIAPDSLHRTNVEKSLTGVLSLLAPGGFLILTEVTRNSLLQLITIGFLEAGNAGMKDDDGQKRPKLLSVEKWKNQLMNHPFVEIATYPEAGNSIEMMGQHVIVAQAPYHTKHFNPDPLRKLLSSKLPEYMVPSVYVPLNSLPLSTNGKVNRQALPDPTSLIKVQSQKNGIAPRSPLEKSLVEIWSHIFETDRIGITDNYFELGGDSLLATKLNAMIRHKLEVEVPLRSIFERPTIAELAEMIQPLVQKEKDISKSVVHLPQAVPVREQRYIPFPLTDIQQAYWIGRRGIYALGNVSTHCYFEIEGIDLDLERVNRAWKRLINQHEMMRAVILPDGQHQQILEHVPPYEIKRLDLRGKSPENVEAELRKIREEMSHQILSTDEWPLFDVRASLFGKQRVRLHISFDNLIFDGWSMFHLLSEWSRLYHQPDATLPNLDLSFRDYVLALEQIKASDLYQRDQEYWFNRLSELPPAPELPLARNPESLSRHRFSRWDSRLNRENWERLKQRATEAGLTPSSLLLTSYAEVLAVWSKRPRFTINLTQFNRLPLHPQVQEIIGDFTSLTLLSVDNARGKTFLERGKNLQSQLLQDLDHPYLGGVQVQRELAKIHGDHQGVAMPIVFTSALGVDRWGEDNGSDKWLGKLVYNITQTPQVWLDHQVVELDGELLLIWDAVEELFPEGLMDDMFEAYCDLLHRLATEEEIWREETPSLVSIPNQEQRTWVNHTEAPISSDTLISLFGKQVEIQPNHPAVISSNRTFTYLELSQFSDALGSYLIEKGARPNTLIAVVMEKGWEQVVATLGILKSGAAYLPIDPFYPEERRQEILKDGNISLVLTQSWLDDRLNWPKDIERISVDQMTPQSNYTRKLDSTTQTGDLAYVIYTSGSTGAPKGVMIDHRGAVNTILDINRRFSVGPKDRILAISNLNFDLSVYDIFGMLAAGATIVMPEANRTRDPAHWLELIKREQVTVWNTVPALKQMLLEYVSKAKGVLPQSLRLVLLSGDWIPLDLPDKIKAYFKGTEVIGLGGATEASIWSNLYSIQDVDPAWKSIPYGRPMTNQRYYVLNELMLDCPVWVPGRLYIGGIGLAKGYWNDENKSREKFIIHPRTGERLYHTGDLGRYLPDGNLEFLGREDFQVKIRGHRIELGEIETILKRQEGIKDAVVVVSDESHLVGCVVLDPNQDSKWTETEHADCADGTFHWMNIDSAEQQTALEVKEVFNLEMISSFEAYMDRLSTAAICNTLFSLGIFSREGEQYSIDEMMSKYQLHSRFKPLMVHWLNVLVEERLVTRKKRDFFSNDRPLNIKWPDPIRDHEMKLSPEFMKKAQEMKAIFQQNVSLMRGLLKGEVEPLELFLTGDSFLIPEYLNQFNMARAYYIDLARSVFATIVDSYPQGKQIRVLEIGTRAGGLIGHLAPLLSPDRGCYVYVDESSFFTDQMKQKWSEWVHAEYGLFNMNKTPLEQGYEPHTFDVIVADNALHRARNIEKTLEYLKRMLAPGGFILFIESTRNNRLLLTTVGFFEDGFSHLEDARKTNQLPLMAAKSWTDLLTKQEFSMIANFPKKNDDDEIFNQHLMVAQAPRTVKKFRPLKLSDVMRRKLPEYMVPSSYLLLDELPLSANGKVDRKALAELASEQGSLPRKKKVLPITETQIKLSAVWEEILACGQVGIHDNFFELGGDSLRAIQCVNLLKEKYHIELSLQALLESPNLEQLAQYIEMNASATAPIDEDYEEGFV